MVGKEGGGEKLNARGECFMVVFRYETVLA